MMKYTPRSAQATAAPDHERGKARHRDRRRPRDPGAAHTLDGKDADDEGARGPKNAAWPKLTNAA